MRTKDMKGSEKKSAVVIAGTGPAGIELSGMFVQMRNGTISQDYPEFSGVHIGEIYLIDGGGINLGPTSEKLQQYCRESLESFGVNVKADVTVKEFKNDTVFLSDGTTIPSAILIWAACV